jgi:thiosulfate/3-mercaptopyruvate sulfurtransferase
MMKKLFTLTLFVFFSYAVTAQDPWKKEQIMPTKELADKINSNKNVPIILNTGPMDQIKGAVKIGAVNSPEGMQKLRNHLNAADKKTEVVIYCGCCSYANCPNIRPAFNEAVKLGFNRVKVLDIPEGFGTDWTAKGFPKE